MRDELNRLFAFYIMQINLEKGWVQLFSLQLGRLSSLTIVWQSVNEKENSEFKPDVELERDGFRLAISAQVMNSAPTTKPVNGTSEEITPTCIFTACTCLLTKSKNFFFWDKYPMGQDICNFRFIWTAMLLKGEKLFRKSITCLAEYE